MGSIPHKRSAIGFTGAFLAIIIFNQPGFTQTSWRSGSSLPKEGEAYFSIAYGNGRYVATGQFGTIVASLDSINWFGKAADIPDILLYSVSFGNGVFITAGSNTVFTSKDGIQWEGVQIATDDYLIAANYGDGKYIAVGTRGTVFSSTNGSDWIDRSLDETVGDFYSVCFGNGMFIAMSIVPNEQQQSLILNSLDGSTWNVAVEYPQSLWHVAYGNGLFMAVGDNGTVLTSSDGNTWEQQSTGSKARLLSVEYGSGTYVIVGEEGTILTSSDGYLWSDRSPDTDNKFYSVAYGTDRFIVIGDERVVYTSLFNGATTKSGNSNIRNGKQDLAFCISGTRVRFLLPDECTSSSIDAALFTIAGKKVYSARINLAKGVTGISSFHCAPGMYLMTVFSNGKRISRPVTVTR